MSSISVVIPLYNKAAYVKRTIDSVMNQTFRDIEIVVVDDGSTDGSAEIVQKSFKSERMRVVKKSNGGPSSARNRGVKEAKSEWVVFLDADDLMLPFCLDYFWKLHLANPKVDYIIGNFFLMDGSAMRLASPKKRDGIVTHPFKLEAMRELTERTGSAMYRRDFLMSNPFNEKLRRFEDAECQYRMMRNKSIYMSHIPVMITDRTAFSASLCRNNIEEEFGGHLEFDGKTFWEQMCLYLLAIDFRSFYPDEAKRLYDREFRRLDLRIVYLFLRLKWRIRSIGDPLCTRKTYSLDYLLSNTDYSVFI